jgi:PTH1 family peptidyl-tRNA hydrolase
MKIIVGLGNPGFSYRRTRHNLGFMAVRALAGQRGLRFRRGKFRSSYAEGVIGQEKIALVRPMTFMNDSGITVAGAARHYECEPQDILAVCDNVDLDLGRLRLRCSGGAGGHRGLRSIISHLRSEDFPRLRLGIGRPAGDVDVTSYVLGVFRRSEWPTVHEVIDRAVRAIETWVYYGPEEAMNRFNQAAEADVDNARPLRP